jgi:hypothetical protein
VDARELALAAGYPFALPGGGEVIRPRELTPARLRSWAAALAALHALTPPAALGELPLPDWMAQVPQPWPVDVAPLLAQAAGMRLVPAPPGARGRFCHGRWWLRHARFDGEALAGVDGWEAAGRGDPAVDVAAVLIGLVADAASAAAAESFAGAFAAAYAEAGGAPLRGLGAWHVALAGQRLAAALVARGRGAAGTAAAEVTVWARLLGRLLTRPQD